MRKAKTTKAKIKAKNSLKEKAFTLFSRGKFTPRELANKYHICETELSRYFTKRFKIEGYPKTSTKEKQLQPK